MKAELDFWVWLVIIAIGGLSKLFGKQESSDSSGPPPIQRRARPQRQRPVRQRTVGQHPELPKTHRSPAVRPAAGQQKQKTQQPTTAPPQQPEWQASQDQVRNFLEEIQRRAVSQQNQKPFAQRQAQLKQVQRAPVQQTRKPSEPVHQPTTPPVIKQNPKSTFQKAPAITPTPKPLTVIKQTSSRASKWAQALRDKQNIRNVIVATEILGPPKALQHE